MFNCFIFSNQIYQCNDAPQFFVTIINKMETLDTNKLSTTLNAFLLRFECLIVIELELCNFALY